jgi:hypothetical protein
VFFRQVLPHILKDYFVPSKTKLEELNGWVMAFVMISITMKTVDLIMVTAVVAM